MYCKASYGFCRTWQPSAIPLHFWVKCHWMFKLKKINSQIVDKILGKNSPSACLTLSFSLIWGEWIFLLKPYLLIHIEETLEFHDYQLMIVINWRNFLLQNPSRFFSPTGCDLYGKRVLPPPWIGVIISNWFKLYFDIQYINDKIGFRSRNHIFFTSGSWEIG